MIPITQSSTYAIKFPMTDSQGNLKTGLTGISVYISKGGGAFAQLASPTVTEDTNLPGWYAFTLSATDTNTEGELAIVFRATGAIDANFAFWVTPVNQYNATNLGLANLDVAVSTRSTLTASDVWNYTARTLTAFSTSLAVAVWDVLESAIGTANSIGVKVKTNLDTTVSSRSTLTAAEVWGYTSRTLTSFGTLVSDIWSHSTRTLTAFSTSLAQSVWDVLESAIVTTGSIGLKVKTNLDATVSSRSTLTASDVWNYTTRTLTAFSTSLAQSVWDVLESAIAATGSIGVRVKTNLDATVSSRSTLSASDVWNYASRTLTSFGTLASDVASAVWTTVTEGTLTALQYLRLLGAVLFGNRTVTGGTQNYKSLDGTKDRVVGSVDASGNRNITTRDGS